MRWFVVWRGTDEWRAEACTVELGDHGLHAEGVQVGAGYRLEYQLRTDAELVTEGLRLSVHDADGERGLHLRRHPDGSWTADDRPQAHVRGALDCDLAFSPLTNFMPARRLRGRPTDHVMAWVSVPDLAVLRSEQRYEPIDGRRVRFVDLEDGFTAKLELDENGLLVRYPQLAERV